jgi:hypothetical protein
MFFRLFPFIVVSVFMLAGFACLKDCRWNEAIYSFCAAALNFVVYFKPFQ